MISEEVAAVENLIKNLEIKAGVMEMGERIAWGSDTALMREAAHYLKRLSAAKQREKYAAIEAENKALKNNWRMTFAGQAMQALIVSQPQFSDAKVIAYTAFMVAEAMLKEAETSI